MAERFVVTSITKDVMTIPGQGAGPALRVAFVTRPNGVVGEVLIPASSFTQEEAERAVSAQAAVLESVMEL